MTFSRTTSALAVALATITTSAAAQTTPAPVPGSHAAECPSCAGWNAPQAPVRIFGNVHYVGTHGLSAILLTSPAGHVLIDGALPESADSIAAHIRALGFREQDVKLIVNSHVHFDHAGGIAALQAMSGARVAASPASAPVLRTGISGRDDPQYGSVIPYPAVKRVDVIADGETLHVGPIALTAHFTPGHTPGGTSWSWRSCDAGRCLDFVYADSQTPVSTDGFLFTRNTTYPTALADFARGQALLETLKCDVLLTPHPGASDMFERFAARDASSHGLVDAEGCRTFVAGARAAVAKRVATETGAR